MHCNPQASFPPSSASAAQGFQGFLSLAPNSPMSRRPTTAAAPSRPFFGINKLAALRATRRACLRITSGCSRPAHSAAHNIGLPDRANAESGSSLLGFSDNSVSDLAQDCPSAHLSAQLPNANSSLVLAGASSRTIASSKRLAFARTYWKGRE